MTEIHYRIVNLQMSRSAKADITHLQFDKHIGILGCCHLVLGLQLFQLISKISNAVQFGIQLVYALLVLLQRRNAWEQPWPGAPCHNFWAQS